MNVMCELRIKGVGRGRMPVMAKPAKGTGDRLGLVDRRFEAYAPNCLHRVRARDRRVLRLHDVRHRCVCPQDCRLGVRHATTMGAEELPPWALEQGHRLGCVPQRNGRTNPPQRS